MVNVFVTGANGMLGQAMLALLRDANVDVIAPSRSQLNLLDKTACVEALAGIDVLIHLATVQMRGGVSTEDVERLNRTITTNILAAAEHNAVPLVLTCGTILQYKTGSGHLREDQLQGPPFTDRRKEYTQSKHELLEALRDMHKRHGTRVVFAVMPSMFGPHDQFRMEGGNFLASAIARLSDATRDGTPTVGFFGSAGGHRDYLYTRDAASALWQLVQAELARPALGVTVVNIGSGDIHTPSDVATHISTAVGYNGTVTFPTQEGPDLRVDTTKLASLIGKLPHTPFDVALHETVAWFREHDNK